MAAPLQPADKLFEAAVNANMLTSIRLVKAAIPYMRATGWGRICLITSSTNKKPSPVLSLSNTARTGLWAWAKIAADEVANDGITINSACPGLHDTERIRALGHTGARIGDPADFGRVVAFLCSQPANFINGAALLVDGGAYHGLH